MQIVSNKNDNILINTKEKIEIILLFSMSKISPFTPLPIFLGQWLTQQGFPPFVSMFYRMQHLLQLKTDTCYHRPAVSP